MMRDDVLKRRMRAGRPEPTLAFTNSARSALERLPQKRRGLRFLPASAIVFVAVALLCVAVINSKTIGSLFAGGPGSSGQFAAGVASETPMPTPNSSDMQTSDPATSETPLPTPNPSDMQSSDPATGETPEPTPTPGDVQPSETPRPTPGTPETTAKASGMPGPDVTPVPTDGGVLMQPVNASGSAKGIKATVLQAGTDGYVLELKIKAGPFEDRTEPNNNMKIRIDGRQISTTEGYKLQQTWDDATPKGYVTYTQLFPLTKKITSGSIKIELDFDYSVPNELYINSKQDEANLKFTSVPFQIPFDLAVHTPDELNASGSGEAVYGNEATLAGVYRSDSRYTVYSLKVSDDAAGDLQKYYNKHKSSGSERVVFTPDAPKKFQIYLCNKHVSQGFVDGFSCAEAINMCLASGDPKADGVSPWSMMMLEKADGGGFLLTVIDVVNPDLNVQVDNDFTIITKNFSGQDAAASCVLQGTIH